MPLPIIPLLTTAAELGVSAAQLISAHANKKRIVPPSSEDSRQDMFLKELNQNRANLSTGSAYRSFIDSINQDEANTINTVTKNAGGYVGAAIGAADTINKSAGDAKAKLGGEALNVQDQVNQERGALISEMAKRKYDVQLMKYGQNQADYRENKQAGFSNLLATLGTIDPSDYAKKTPDTGTTDPTSSLLSSWYGGGTDSNKIEGVPLLNPSKGGFADKLMQTGLDLQQPEPFSPLNLTGGGISDWLMKKKRYSGFQSAF